MGSPESTSRGPSLKRVALGIAVAIGLFVIAGVIDFAIIEKPRLIKRGPPQLTGPHVLRDLVLLASAAVFVMAMTWRNPPRFDLDSRNSFRSLPQIKWIPLVCLIIFLVLLVFNISTLRSLAKEDRTIETTQAILLFVTGFVAFWVAIIARPKLGFGVLPYVLAGLGACFMGFEEIAWTQHYFDFETPEFMSWNRQGEVTLHNYSSRHFEIAHFVAGFIVLILIPFLHETTGVFRRSRFLSISAPGRAVLLMSAGQCCCSFKVWPNLWIPWFFFTTGLILCYYLRHAVRGRFGSAIQWPFMTTLLVVYVVIQAAFLVNPTLHQERTTMPFELREFFISLGLCVVAFEWLARWRNITAGEATDGVK